MNKFKFSSFISSADFASKLRDRFPSRPLVAHDTYILPTPTSRGSNWTLHLLCQFLPALLWSCVFIQSVPAHHSQKLKTSVISGFLLHSPTIVIGHQFLPNLPLQVYLESIHSSFSQLLRRWVSRATGACELGLWKEPSKDYREWGQVGGSVFASALTGLYTKQWGREAASHISLQ